MSFPFDPAPVILWTLTREEKLASCDVRFVPIGVEARVLTNGKLLYARTFPTGDDAPDSDPEGEFEGGEIVWTIERQAWSATAASEVRPVSSSPQSCCLLSVSLAPAASSCPSPDSTPHRSEAKFFLLPGVPRISDAAPDS
jgi:hypothetical protein